MKQTYTSIFEQEREREKGLTTTNQGGEAYKIDCWGQLKRFLILGTEGGSFYVNEKTLTKLNIASVKKCLNADPIRTIDIIVEVSDKAHAPSNEPALVALSMAASYQNTNAPKVAEQVRTHALRHGLKLVARTGTHLLHFTDYVDKQRGWGSSLRKGIGQWFLEQSPSDLAYQISKYQQRDGWSMADLLRKSHPKTSNIEQNAIFKYIVDGELHYGDEFSSLRYLKAVEDAKTAEKTQLLQLISDFNLPREVIPTQFLNFPDVWETLLYAGKGMPMTAMLRNLGNMSKVGLLVQGSEAARFITKRLQDQELIKRSRLHPIDFIKAKLIYQSGQGLRGSGVWKPVQSVVDALETGFYLAFDNVQPTNKRLLLALDVSGSMSGGMIAGIPGFTPGLGTAVLSMVTAQVESDYEILGFTSRLIDLGISKHDSLNEAMRKVSRSDWGGTRCELPMKYALETRRKFDAFCIYTDNDTGYGNPSVDLRIYRQKSGIHDAKMIVNGMVANEFSIADPTDRYMLDVVGFDSSAPAVMSAFIRGEV